jgi:hypothetical protein
VAILECSIDGCPDGGLYLMVVVAVGVRVTCYVASRERVGEHQERRRLALLHRNDERIQIINEQENGLCKQKTFSDLKLLNKNAQSIRCV